MKKIGLILVWICTANMLFAQSGKLKKADNFYNKLSYSYAASLYEELVGSEVDSPELKGKLAVCYYNMGDTKKAEQTFSTILDSPALDREKTFMYAQALKQNGKYAESDTWMKKFHQTAQTDTRGLSFVNNTSYLSKIEKQGAYVSINHLKANSSSADFGGYPGLDNTSLFISSRKKSIAIQNEHGWNSKRFLDVYKAVRMADKEFDSIVMIPRKVNTRYHEGPLCYSPDGKIVYFTRNNISRGKLKRDNNGIQNLKIFIADVDQNGNWINEREFPINSKDYSVGHPTITADGKTLYFVSDMPGGFGGADIYKTSILGDNAFSKPENLGKQINTEGQDMFPWISADGHLFFSSNGHIGLGGLDVFVMTPSKKGGFDQMINVGKPLNSQYDDFAMTMFSDNKTGYFSSNREGGAGDDDIYAYTLLRPFKINYTLEGVVTDNKTNEILPGATVQLKDQNGKVIATTTADAAGKYAFDLEPDMNYTVAVQKDNYFDNSAKVSTVNVPADQANIKKDIALEKDPGLALYCLITDKKSGQPIEGVQLKITDKKTGKEFLTTLTSSSGDALKAILDKKVGDQASYTIELSKEGYLTKTVDFNQQIAKPGIIKVHEMMDLSMSRPDVGMDLSKIININPIYFDLNKYNIRKDAAIELDKIVKVMNEYPTMVVELGSHTDCRGSIASNAKLSDNRAKASAAYIKARITNPERIYGKGYGEAKLITNCPCEGPKKSTCSEEEHQKNRRTEFVIMKM